MIENTPSISQESEVNSSIKDVLINRTNSLLHNPNLRVLLRLGRILLYVFGFWTMFLYFWSIIGIVIGVAIAVVSEGAWRRHGFILSYSSAAFSIAFSIYAWIWIFLIAFFLIIYGINLISLGLSKILKKPRNVLKLLKIDILMKQFHPSPRMKTIATLMVFLGPFLLWSSVNINLGVAFNNSPELLWVHSPTTVNRGDVFGVVVEAWDPYERLSVNYQGTVEFSLQSYNITTGLALTGVAANLPETYTFTGGLYGPGLDTYASERSADFGLHLFSFQINTTGIHYVLVEDSHTQNTYWSNPIIVYDFAANSPRIYWGDVHCHSDYSDGSGSPAETYLYGRYISRLDFMALTDHGEHFTIFNREKANTSKFRNYLQATASANAPGEFVSFYGLEWTSRYSDQAFWFIPVPDVRGGHYTCIFSGNSTPLFSSITETKVSALWSALDDFTSSTGARALAIPHHTIRDRFIQDWTLMNPKYVKLVEVTSVHGSCLYDNELNYMGSVDLPKLPVPGSSIIDALNMGYRMTFIANGDSHDGRPGHSISHTGASVGHQYPFTLYNARRGHPYPSGITAVYATSLTRDGIFSGLENGLVYATSDYGRPILEFSINDVPVSYNSTVALATPTTTRNLTIFFAQDGSPAARVNQAAFVEAGWMPNWNATIEIIKNGLIWQAIEVTSPISTITISDFDQVTGTSYDSCIERSNGNFYINRRSRNPIDPTTLTTNGLDYYAIRIVGANGRTSYIGPIWVQSS
jgi:hypothetical protein